jgi:hypothetical protein
LVSRCAFERRERKVARYPKLVPEGVHDQRVRPESTELRIVFLRGQPLDDGGDAAAPKRGKIVLAEPHEAAIWVACLPDPSLQRLRDLAGIPGPRSELMAYGAFGALIVVADIEAGDLHMNRGATTPRDEVMGLVLGAAWKLNTCPGVCELASDKQFRNRSCGMSKT